MNRAHFMFVFKRLAVIESVIISGVLIICLIAGWHRTAEIARALMGVGIMIMAVGVYGMMGRRSAPRGFPYLYTQTALQDELGRNRVALNKRQMAEGERAMLQGLVVGGLVMLIAFVIDAVFA